MGDLFGDLTRRLDANARRAVDTFLHEVPEYRATSSALAAATLDFAVFIRRRSIASAGQGMPLGEDDLAVIQATGRQRGEHRLSMASQRHVLSLHTTLLLREVYEAATPAVNEQVLRYVGWLGQQGIAARRAYLDGYLAAVGSTWSVPARAGLLARTLLADEPATADVADQFGLRVAGHYLVTVVRLAPPPLSHPRRDRLVDTLLAQWRVPLTWISPTELVILAPDPAGEAPPAAPVNGDASEVHDPVRRRTLTLIRCLAEEAGQACAVGAAPGVTGALAEPLELARRISQVAPLERTPHDIHTITDRFVELSIAQAPQVDEWLQQVVAQLEAGPELVRTLDAYYRHDMSRLATATALRIHPRTLDYRLQRVRELTGLRPASTRGVRVLATAVVRAMGSS